MPARKKSTTTTQKRRTTRQRSRTSRNTWAGWLLKILLLVLLFFIADYIFRNWSKVKNVLDEIIAETSTTPNPKTPPPNPVPQTPNNTPNNTPNTAKTTVKIASWNLMNMGLSKNEPEIAFIANVIKDYDIVAIQEVSVEEAGAQAIARLSEQLNRRGNKWQYDISSYTSGEGSERYAYLWKSSKATIYKNTWLAKGQQLDKQISREPALARFAIKGRYMTIANFHAVPISKNPKSEIVLLDNLHRLYAEENLVIVGDFNLSQKDPAFDELKQNGYKPALINQKTSLRRIVEPSGNYLSQEYDNIFVENALFQIDKSGINDFVTQAKSLKNANEISDHLPIWCEISWK